MEWVALGLASLSSDCEILEWVSHTVGQKKRRLHAAPGAAPILPPGAGEYGDEEAPGVAAPGTPLEEVLGHILEGRYDFGDDDGDRLSGVSGCEEPAARLLSEDGFSDKEVGPDEPDQERDDGGDGVPDPHGDGGDGPEEVKDDRGPPAPPADVELNVLLAAVHDDVERSIVTSRREIAEASLQASRPPYQEAFHDKAVSLIVHGQRVVYAHWTNAALREARPLTLWPDGRLKAVPFF